jgi:lipopolysaccharide biosynthesis regulator YciM
MEEVLIEEPGHETALRVLAALYEEQARFNEAAGLWQRIGKARKEDTGHREHHLLVAAAQAALGRDDLDSAKQLLKAAQKHEESAHFFAAAAELAAAKGNHRGAKERLKQALVADPALAPHLLPGLVAAEQGLIAAEQGKGAPARSAREDREDRDDLDDEPSTAAALEGAGPGAAPKQLEAGADPAAAGAPGDAAVPDAATSTALATTAPASLATTPPASLATPPADLAPALAARVKAAATPPIGVPLVAATPALGVADRVLSVLAEVEAQTGPRLELALIRAQLVPPGDAAGAADLAKDLVARFPDALAARVATARLALAGGGAAGIRTALEVLVADDGALAWALRGRWQCAQCGARPGAFSWRCGQCRRWASLRMETGIEPPPVPSRERRAVPRTARPEGLLGAAPDESLPAATLDPGLTDDELARAGERRSLLGRVGGWFSGAWRRDRR